MKTKEFNLNNEIIKLSKQLEKDCFTEFGFTKNNDVKWIIRKSVELCVKSFNKKEEEFIKRLKELQDKIIGRIEQVMKKPMPNVKKYAKEEIDKLAGDKLI